MFEDVVEGSRSPKSQKHAQWLDQEGPSAPRPFSVSEASELMSRASLNIHRQILGTEAPRPSFNRPFREPLAVQVPADTPLDAGRNHFSPSVRSRLSPSEVGSPKIGSSSPLALDVLKAWEGFDELDAIWKGSTPGSKVTQMQQLFAQVSNLEFQCLQAENATSCVRDLRRRGVDRLVVELTWSNMTHTLRETLSAWSHHAMHIARLRLDGEVADSNQAVKAAKEERHADVYLAGAGMGVKFLGERKNNNKLRQCLASWLHWAKSSHQYEVFGDKCVKAVGAVAASEAARAVEKTLLRWYWLAMSRSRKRHDDAIEEERKCFDDERIQLKGTIEELKKQMEALARRHENLGDECVQARKNIDTFLPRGTSSASRPGSARSSKSNPHSPTGVQNPSDPLLAVGLPNLLEERATLAAQFRSAQHFAEQVQDKVAHARSVAEVLQRRIRILVVDKGSRLGEPGNESELLERELRENSRFASDGEVELGQLRNREARLRISLEEVERKIESFYSKPVELIHEGVQLLQLHFVQVVAAEREKTQDLFTTCTRIEENSRNLRVEEQAESVRWQSEVKLLRAECAAEVVAERQRNAVCQNRHQESEAWIHHLTESIAAKEDGTRILLGQERILGQIQSSLRNLGGDSLPPSRTASTKVTFASLPDCRVTHHAGSNDVQNIATDPMVATVTPSDSRRDVPGFAVRTSCGSIPGRLSDHSQPLVSQGSWWSWGRESLNSATS